MEETKTQTRHVGIDLGKRTYETATVGKGGKVQRSNGKTTPSGFASLMGKLRPGDKVAIEAGNLSFDLAKAIIATAGCKVYVLNTNKLALIYGSMKKTDKEDALKLAHIIEDVNEDRLPVVPLPSDKEAYRRKLVIRCDMAKKRRVSALNQLHAQFVSNMITTKTKKDLYRAASREKAVQELSGIEREEAEHLCEGHIAALKQKMAEEAVGDKDIERLQSIPGVASTSCSRSRREWLPAASTTPGS